MSLNWRSLKNTNLTPFKWIIRMVFNERVLFTRCNESLVYSTKLDKIYIKLHFIGVWNLQFVVNSTWVPASLDQLPCPFSPVNGPVNVRLLDNPYPRSYDRGDFIAGVGYLLPTKRCNSRGLNTRPNTLTTARTEFPLSTRIVFHFTRLIKRDNRFVIHCVSLYQQRSIERN